MNQEKENEKKEEDLVKGEVGAMLGGEVSDSFDGNLGRIVDDHRLVASQKQLQHRVTSDVTGATGHKYTRRHRQQNYYK